MKYDHPHILVEQPAPGFFTITGHQPQSIFVDGVGHFVPPTSCIITKEVPPALLRVLADELEGKHPDSPPVTLPSAPPPAPEIPDNTNDGEEAEEEEGEPTLVDRITNILADGNIQVNKLAERLGVTAEAIKALDAETDAFHIGHGGWVKAGKKGGEA